MTGETAFEIASSRLQPSPWPARLAVAALLSLATSTVGLLAARECESSKVAKTRAAKIEVVRRLFTTDNPTPTAADVLAATGGDPVVEHSAKAVARKHGLALARQAEQMIRPEERRAARYDAANALEIAETLGDVDAARLRAECLFPLIEESVATGKRREAAGICREVARAFLEAAAIYDRAGRPEEAHNCRQNAGTVSTALADLEESSDD